MKYLFIIGFLISSWSATAQDKKIDQLEVLYDQGYYTKVLRKSKRLLAQPEYDYSGLPAFYKSLAIFRLADDEQWFKRHSDCISEATTAYAMFTDHEKIDWYIKAHYHEIASLKTYLVDLETKFRGQRLNGSADEIAAFRLTELKRIKAKPNVIIPPTIDEKESGEGEIAVVDHSTESGSDFRHKLVVYAKSLVGVKYVWAGNDPNGFDCSGFVGYVHRKYGIVIPRTASAQLKMARKVKINNAEKGDLLFFSSGSTISHVGLVINDKGKNLVMVHASTSKGVIITELEKSTYWKPKLKSAGSYIS